MNKTRGFTLIELMVVVAVVAIIAAIALPAYFAQIRHSRRSEVKGAMQSAALAQERVRADCSTYASAWSTVPTGCTSTVTTGANPYTSSYYNLAFSNDTASTYTFTATAVGTQAKDTAFGTSCGTLYYAFGVDAAVNTACSVTTAAGVITKCPTNCWAN